MAHQGEGTQVIDGKGHTLIPGLNDSHTHLIRAGLNYNMELRWDGVRSVDRALEMLREQAARTPEGEWVRVIGGWGEFQFEERRLPTLEEINAAVKDLAVMMGIKIEELYQQFLQKVNDPREEAEEAAAEEDDGGLTIEGTLCRRKRKAGSGGSTIRSTICTRKRRTPAG